MSLHIFEVIHVIMHLKQGYEVQLFKTGFRKTKHKSILNRFSSLVLFNVINEGSTSLTKMYYFGSAQ